MLWDTLSRFQEVLLHLFIGSLERLVFIKATGSFSSCYSTCSSSPVIVFWIHDQASCSLRVFLFLRKNDDLSYSLWCLQLIRIFNVLSAVHTVT